MITFTITNTTLPVIATKKIRSVSFAHEYLIIPAYVLKIKNVTDLKNKTKGIINESELKTYSGISKLTQ